LLTTLDVAPLAVYCDAYDRSRAASEVFAQMRSRDAVTQGLMVKSADGNACANPLVRIAAAAADEMIAVAGLFGMTPVALAARRRHRRAIRAIEVQRPARRR